jgi:hypothetical protein
MYAPWYNSVMFDLEPYLWSGIAVSTGVFIVMGVIFHHHWSYYGIQGRSRASAEALFIFGGVVLMAAAAGCALSYRLFT